MTRTLRFLIATCCLVMVPAMGAMAQSGWLERLFEEIEGSGGSLDKREIAAEDYFDGMFTTALEDGELITAVRFPVPDKAAYTKFPNPASRYAVVGVMVAETGGAVRVAVTGAAPCVFRASDMEQALNGSFDSASIEGVSISADALNADIHASAEYRAHLVGVMARRAVEGCG